MPPVPKRAHNAGCLAFATVVTYPFHPLVGQTVLVVGDTTHADARYLIIRKSDGTAFQIPAWMTAPEAISIRIIAYPRLPVNRLIELRALVDRLVASSIGEQVPDGGRRNDTMEDGKRGSLRAAAHGRGAGTAEGSGDQASHGAADGSVAIVRRARHSRKRAGGGS